MDGKISRRSLLQTLSASAVPAFVKPRQRIYRANLLLDLPQFINQSVIKVSDRFAAVDPGQVVLQGFLGERCRNNETARLLMKNEEEMLAGYEQRPGNHPYVGHHVGKWIHAATLSWASTKDGALRAKLDKVVSRLIATQKDDGYLGTYEDGAHWGMGEEQRWDVWVHKYVLLGLLTYHNFTGESASLEAAKKIGELLVSTFGPKNDAGAGLDLNERSTSSGMASGSVLEPMVLLYRATREEKYLNFARFIADHWEGRNGPKLISGLTEKRSVRQLGDAKAYEMLSCLVGLAELYRSTGDNRYLIPVVNAWKDIAGNQLLITGSGSCHEHWTQARQFASSASDETAETCVTVSWIQLTQQLLRLTGESRYADELEKTFYNHLAAAQKPDGSAWAHFTALDGRKPYQTEQNCCTSSGPRGWALLPTFAYLTCEDGIVINFLTSSTATLNVNGEKVTIRQETSFPVNGSVSITVTVPRPMKFALQVRVPSWSKLNGVRVKPGEYFLLRQTWSRKQTIKLDFEVPVRILPGEGSDAGKIAIARGPQVLAVDEAYNS
ncbi:MAG: glycoside hydrolase family 127 protein, partial [Blastocatellia bacterium]|nr:glycoside hydrolase family 127 protein [Blastocatellia bacterium]